MTNLTDWLTQARDRADAATEGPWHWRNTNAEVHLLGDRTRVVMGFERMGMHGAQPSFPRPGDGLIYPAGRDNLHAIPNALFMAHARTDLPATLDAIQAVLAIHHADGVYDPSDACGHKPDAPGYDDHHGENPDGDRLCYVTQVGSVCHVCHDVVDAEPFAFPCPTVRAIATALGVSEP